MHLMRASNPPQVALAPIAQTVERLHGKEKVNGSIPFGGSVTLAPGRYFPVRLFHLAG